MTDSALSSEEDLFLGDIYAATKWIESLGIPNPIRKFINFLVKPVEDETFPRGKRKIYKSVRPIKTTGEFVRNHCIERSMKYKLAVEAGDKELCEHFCNETEEIVKIHLLQQN